MEYLYLLCGLILVGIIGLYVLLWWEDTHGRWRKGGEHAYETQERDESRLDAEELHRMSHKYAYYKRVPDERN